MATHIKRNPTAHVRQARLPVDLTYEKMTPQARQLVDLSREYEESGAPLLTQKQIEQRLAQNRKCVLQDDDE